MQLTEIIAGAAACGIRLDREQAGLLLRYWEILQEENKKYNLTRIDGLEPFLYEHCCDSLSGVVRQGGCPSPELLDLGSGAGFPGIPLKILCPSLRVYLLEATQKKIAFLETVIRKLGLKEISCLHLRAEDWGRGAGRGKYGWVIARAVAPLVTLAELALPLLQKGGFFWAFKGPAVAGELAAAEKIIALCGGTLRERINYTLPPAGKERTILVLEKVGETEGRFPRRAGIPQKRPFYA